MDSATLLEKFRLEVFDTVEPFLWSDDEALEYMDDAHKMFCRLTDGIPDATSDLTIIDFLAGDEWLPIDERVLKIRKAYLASTNKPVGLINFEDLGSVTHDTYGYPIPTFLDNSTGDVTQIVLGMEQDQVRLIKIPEVDDTMRLIIYRLPLTDITATGQAFEIHQRHHVHLLHWMKHRAYSKHDAETFNKGKADEFEMKFRNYCEQSRVEGETRRHKERTVSYGGY